MNENLAQDLLAVDRKFAATSVREGAVAAYKKYLVEEATFLPNRREAVQGLPNICEAITIPGVEYTLKWEPATGKVAESGELGFTWGNYTLSYTEEDGKEVVEKGKYMNVWVKREESWKVLVDMGNLSE